MNLLKLFIPDFCISCDDVSFSTLCESCSHKIKHISGSICQVCGRPSGLKHHTSYICYDCVLNPLFFDWHRSLFIYDKPLSDWIYRLKFKYDLVYLKYFGEEILNRYGSIIKSVDYIIPVPLSKERLKQRGFNQSLELAKYISKKLKVNYLRNDLVKVKNTPNQTDLKKNDRKNNLRGVFQFRSNQNLENKKVLLIDDVFTTGSTLNECSKVLKKEGVKYVFGLTIARR